MFRKSSVLLVLILMAAAVALTVSCAKKKTGEEAPVVGDTTNDSSVVSEPLSFDAQGSDSGKIAGLKTVHFEYDKARLSDEGKQILADDAKWMKGHKDVVVQVEGHCDKRGSIEYNLALGERRAKAVKGYLVSLGVDSKNLTIISYGKEKLMDLGDSEEAHTKNRRANFVPIPK